MLIHIQIRKNKKTPEEVPSIKQVLSADKIKRSTDDLFVLLFHTAGRQHSLPPGGRWHAAGVPRSE